MTARYGSGREAFFQYIYYDGKRFYYRNGYGGGFEASAPRSFQYMKSEDITRDGVTRKEIILTNSPKETPSFPEVGNSSMTGVPVYVASFVCDPSEPHLNLGENEKALTARFPVCAGTKSE